MKKVFTIGYQGSEPHILRGILLDQNISHLIDIRRHNTYRESRFNKEKLGETCKDLGISYLHELNLAPSGSLVASVRKKEAEIKKLVRGRTRMQRERRLLKLEHYSQEVFKPEYLQEMAQKDGLRSCKKAIDEAARPCFLCFEKLAAITTCHRKFLLDFYMQEYPNTIEVIHLDGKFFHRGKEHNLRESFRHVNETYFDGKLSPSEVAFSWGKCRSWGLFEPPNLIFIHSMFDSPHIPEFVVNSILHHELIHYCLFRDGKPYSHTVGFYLEELDFKQAGAMFQFEKRFPIIQKEMQRTGLSLHECLEELEHVRQYLMGAVAEQAEGNDEPE